MKQVPDSTIYTLTLATDGDPATGDIVFLLVDPATNDHFVGTADGLEELSGGFEPETGKITSADDYTVLTVDQVNARQDDIAAFSVPTDDGAIKSQGLSVGLRGLAAAVVRRGLRLRDRRGDRPDLGGRRRRGVVRQRGRRHPGPGLEGQRRLRQLHPRAHQRDHPQLVPADRGLELRVRDPDGRHHVRARPGRGAGAQQPVPGWQAVLPLADHPARTPCRRWRCTWCGGTCSTPTSG